MDGSPLPPRRYNGANKNRVVVAVTTTQDWWVGLYGGYYGRVNHNGVNIAEYWMSGDVWMVSTDQRFK